MSSPPPRHIKGLRDRSRDVLHLLELHRLHWEGSVAGGDARFQTLNKSAIVLLVASWEAYVEEVVSSAFELIVSRARSHDDIPTKVRLLAVAPLRDSKDQRKIWELAGEGWRQVLRAYLKQVIEPFHTPRPKNVDELFASLLDDKFKLSDHWGWHRMPASSVSIKLNELVDIRGAIAHGRHERDLRRRNVEGFARFIERLAHRLSNVVREQLATRGIDAWPAVREPGRAASQRGTRLRL